MEAAAWETYDLKVSGATVYVTAKGTGPTLLIIPGAPADVGVFTGIGDILARRFRTVMFELRGLSRSRLDGEAVDLAPADFADDAAVVLDAFGTGPAFVLGCSGGGIVGLDLVTRYPGKVSVLIAHEPPIATVLPNGAEWIAFFDDVHETYTTSGAGVAMAQFIASFGHYAGPEADPSLGEPPAFPQPDFSQMSPGELEFFQRMGKNSEFFISHIIRETPRFRPNVEELKASTTRIVIAIGEESVGQMPHNAARQLADSLGIGTVAFPGDHQGFGTHTDAWAASVERVLADHLGVRGS